MYIKYHYTLLYKIKYYYIFIIKFISIKIEYIKN